MLPKHEEQLLPGTIRCFGSLSHGRLLRAHYTTIPVISLKSLRNSLQSYASNIWGSSLVYRSAVYVVRQRKQKEATPTGTTFYLAGYQYIKALGTHFLRHSSPNNDIT